MQKISRRSLLSVAAGAASLAALQACASEPDDTDPSAVSTEGGAPASETDENSALAAVAATAFATSGLAGCAIRVRHDGELYRASFGYSDLSTEAPYRSSDYVRIASITKTFTATAILRMIDDGLLSFDDRLSRFFPQVANASDITIEQMLGMRSGIFDFTSDDAFGAAFDADPTMSWSIEQTLAVIDRNEPAFAPGTQVVYCDSNFALLGAIAGEVDSASLEEVIQNRVIGPAGLKNTYYPTTAAIDDPHPQAYVPVVRADNTFDTRFAPRIVNEVNPDVPAGAGAIVSTIDDVSTWGDVLAEGTLLGGVTQSRRLETHRFEGQKFDFGYGLGITNFNKYLGHDGAIFGFSSVVLTRPDTKTQVVIVGNESTNATTPTLLMAIAIINEIDPEQGTGVAE